jgi:hypothetical protein
MTSGASSLLHVDFNMRSAASWQTIHDGVQGTALIRFRLISSSQLMQIPNVFVWMRRSALCTLRRNGRS